MGKKKKGPISDNVRNKRKESEKKINPFEVKINKQKQNVLGRKVSKHDKGMPGLSRSKATKRRKETLLQEHHLQFKSNKFVDRRIGEEDATLSVEDKMMKRYAMERARHGEKSNKFNLNEDEELTHYGQSLSEIEKFDDPDVSDDDEEEEDRGKIGAKMVSEEHFGGFLTKKKEEEGDKKSWKERMEELISKSKKAKHERQVEKEKSAEMTAKLDEEFKDVRMLMGALSKGRLEEETPTKADEYDIAVRELKYEIKGKPSDRLKTEEEIAKEEKEKLEELEEDRKRRMKGIVEEDGEKKLAQSHQSADDLDDGFLLDANVEEWCVSYKDGQLNTEDGEKNKDETEDIDDSDEEEEEKKDENDEMTGEEEENEDDDSDEEDDKSDDSFGDIASDSEHEEDVKEEKETDGQKAGKVDLKVRKEMMDAARKELPYTFTAPETYDDLLELLQGHSMDEQLIIIERTRKCHHPSLAEGNKEKLQTLFSLLVQYFGDLVVQDPPQLELADRLTPHLYTLTQLNPIPAAQAVLDQVSERQEEFKQICDRRSGRGTYARLDTLLLLKLVSVLFPTSDFRHPVTTPSLLFLAQMLAQCQVAMERDIAAGLFVCNLCLEYVKLSKRYIPEVINFLYGLLFTAAKKEINEILYVVPPFRPVGKHSNLLLMTEKPNCDSLEPWKLSEVLSSGQEKSSLDTDKFRLCAINNTVTLLKEFCSLYKELPSFREIFHPVTCISQRLPKDLYPTSLQESLQSLLDTISAVSSKPRKHLVVQKQKPQPLRMFEPKIEEDFDPKKKKTKGTKEFNQKQKLLHKHKREMKGAIREIRRDNQFLARQLLEQRLEKDAERKRKVKEIHGMLASQEGDWQAMKRGKKS